jgi:Uma2 family endonuclease
MGTAKASVSFDDYLRMSFPGADAEFVAGEIVERNMGEGPHSQVQTRLIEIFYDLRRRYRLHARAELRLRLSPDVCRIPDVSVFNDKPLELVPSSPPWIVVEILSRDDRYTDLVAKLEEYRTWGVPHIWVVNPLQNRLEVYSAAGLAVTDAFRLPDLAIEIPAAEIFAD